jgi:hypothetical protein
MNLLKITLQTWGENKKKAMVADCAHGLIVLGTEQKKRRLRQGAASY